MDDELEKLWSIVLAVIETEVSKANFLTLFKKTILLSLEDNTATIAAPSTMIIDLIQKRFYELLKTTLDKKTGKDITLIFVPKLVASQPLDKKDGPLFEQSLVKKPAFSGHLPRVRADFTFQNMAVSSTNQLAYISAQTVTKNLGRSYNPLFIYGPVGVGKTHLMQAVANEVYQKDPAKKIIYITSEEFTNEVVEAIRTNQTHILKRKFRSLTLLIIDDIQFIAGKDKVQEELFHTFNILIDAGAQIVLSSDRPPQEIRKLEARLSSRFSGGLTVDIEPPDFELKTAILLIKAKKYNTELSIGVAKIIAEHSADLRQLEGTLLRIMTQASTLGSEITEHIALKALGESASQSSHFHPEDIVKKICAFYDIKPTQLKGPKRDAFLVRARHVTMYVLKKELNLPYVEIGNILGGRDHTTIMHGVEKIEKQILRKEKISEDILGITKFSELS